ncbi:thiosulfate oxidation carrier protein SoxY [Bradyrhizobium ottawaense]|uniref:thiosulfate oxidation carrier protein SoxY n=1 Tax=Bradyrhizobium ottawaense TaxID=931866 RepID=UPI003FA0C8D1
MRIISRRDALLLIPGLTALAWSVTIKRSQATPAEATIEIGRFSGGKTANPSKIALDVPEIAENGNSITLAFDVDHPMTPDSHVTEVLVVADNNPAPRVASFRFTPMSGRAAAATRIRLAGTQVVSVLAKTSDGKLFVAQRQVKVTVGGCGG